MGLLGQLLRTLISVSAPVGFWNLISLRKCLCALFVPGSDGAYHNLRMIFANYSKYNGCDSGGAKDSELDGLAVASGRYTGRVESLQYPT
jgi:hypothetical protein